MKFIADLHIHSKYSRATAKNLDLENIYIAAQLKGITVVGTGDFTHPGWISEIKEKLDEAEPGLFKLQKKFADRCNQRVPKSCRSKVRFLLQTEISNIYKKNNRVRKNHNLVFFQNIESVDRFNARLDKIGNIKSDGRPILGLDARDLLEVVVETSDGGVLIPAHIWTPWFSMLGSKSGFDTVEECFEDLSDYIFAAETGLSSDPAMNWRVSKLDNITLISNSDAHSPRNLGREANIFDTQLSYDAIFSALKSGNKKQFLGTYEFFPEEGKYHLDGHRKCGIHLIPEETLKNEGICPVCGKKLTLGVLYRVVQLADRASGKKPERANPFHCIVPLTHILSDIFRVGPQSKAVLRKYATAIETLGPEFEILHTLSIEKINKAGIPLLGEAIRRMRTKRLNISPGYDGEYGKVAFFNPGERKTLMGQRCLFDIPESTMGLKPTKDIKKPGKRKKPPAPNQPLRIPETLNPQQQKAVNSKSNYLLIVAGPGTGKTSTLTRRISFLIDKKNISARHILALTFTRKAAKEMLTRLKRTLKSSTELPLVLTFHSLCVKILREIEGASFSIIDDIDRGYLIREALEDVTGKKPISTGKILEKISLAKQNIAGTAFEETLIEPERDFFIKVYHKYQALLSVQHLYDFDDLIARVVALFEKDATVRRRYQTCFKYIFVDEYQDLNQGQVKLLNILAPPEARSRRSGIEKIIDLCVIGDPDQSIYGFRGSDVIYFKNFKTLYPDAEVIHLDRNYRSTETILAASYQVIKNHQMTGGKTRTYSNIAGPGTITILESVSEKAEAVTVGKSIETLIGGIGFHSMDFENIDTEKEKGHYGFSDFAVLFRTLAQGEIFKEFLERAGIPCQIASKENMFTQKGVAEIISYFKMTASAGTFIDFERVRSVSKPGIDKKTATLFKNWCYQNQFNLSEGMDHALRLPINGITTAKQLKLATFIKKTAALKAVAESLSVAETLEQIINRTGIGVIIDGDENIKKSVQQIKTTSKQYGKDILSFLCDIALQTDSDSYDEKAEKVSLMTMHAAKGLEFSVVFIAGCEDGFIPFEKNGRVNDIEEERRLFYVAMTRAKQKLYLSYVKKRRVYGKTLSRQLSPFVQDMDPHLIEYGKKYGIPKKGPVQLELF